MRIITLIAVICIGSHVFADSVPAGYKQEDEFKSATEDTVVKAYRGKPYDWTGPLQFRVFRKESPSVDGYLLWKAGFNRASVLISSDGENIAINHHAMSDLGLLYVFTRQMDGTYKQIDVDFQEQASQMFEKSLAPKSGPTFDHSYCYAKTWLTDHQFLGCFSGHESGKCELSGYWFIFDCNTKRFTFNLTDINKNSLHYFHKGKSE